MLVSLCVTMCLTAPRKVTKNANTKEKVTMKILFFDTETTGLKVDNLPCIHPKQPMLIQLGIKVDDVNRHERARISLLARTMGWEMGAKAKEITGLSEPIADEFGAHFITAVELFIDLIENVDIVVAHNAGYDVTVMRRAVKVYCDLTQQEYWDVFEGKTIICTMLAAMDIVKATPKRYGKWKWPNLIECMRFFFNEDHSKAHDALADVLACARVFYELLDDGVFAEPKAA